MFAACHKHIHLIQFFIALTREIGKRKKKKKFQNKKQLIEMNLLIWK